MNLESIYDETFEGLNTLQIAEYESCTFRNCRFADVNLSNFNFEDCQFIDCDLSSCKLGQTALKEVKFQNCKLLGLRFDDCNPFLLAMEFVDCQVNFSSFYQLKIPKTKFSNCKLQEVEWVQTDLTESIFDNCDFERSVFEDTNLLGADFRTSYNFAIDPEKNNIRQAKFSLQGLPNLLTKHKINIF